MSEHVEGFTNAIVQAASSKSSAAVGLVTAGTVVKINTDPQFLGNYLSSTPSYFVHFLSWTELFQTIGVIFITIQLILIITAQAVKISNYFKESK